MIEFRKEHVTYEELLRAYHDCRKRKRRTENALQFEIDDGVKLYNLWAELNSGKYEIGKSIAFCVDKPVKREVFAADFRDRIVHHLFVNRTNESFEREFIYDTYSCRKKKGTSMAVRRCAEMMHEATDGYTKKAIIVKGDLKSFFMTIDKEKLYEKVSKFLEEKYENGDLAFTLELKKKIIFNEPQRNCIRKQPRSSWEGLPKEKSLFYCEKSKGLPIGNLTSQLDANFYLNEFDHWMKEELRLRWYGRYVDDFFYIVPTAKEAKETLRKVRTKLEEIGVKLHPKKLYIQEVRKGVKFVGAVIKPNRVYVSNRTKGQFWQTMKKYGEQLENNKPTEEEVKHFVSSVNSYLGFMKHYNTYNIRRRMMESEAMRSWGEYCWVSEDFKKIGTKKKAA